MSQASEYEITLDKLVYGGEAMGRLPDGRAVFVPFALPGETIRARLVEEKRGFARGELLEVVQPSPARISPRCKHFMACGGCHYQHIPYEMQVETKAEILRDQLARIGKIDDPPVKPTVPSPSPWNYRNHIQFHVDDQGRLGFQGSRSHEVIPIEECHLPEEVLNDLWPQIDIEPLPELTRVGLRLGVDDEVLLVLESSTDEAFDFTVDVPVAAVQLGPEQTHILSDRFYLEMEVLDRTFRVSGDSFFQVNTPMAAKMVEHLLEHLSLTLDTTFLDIYCGVGLFSAFMAPRVGRLMGIESNPSAVDDFTFNLDEFDHVEIYQAAAEEVLPGLDVQADVVLVDPPRAGLSRDVLDAILNLHPATLAYVSCDPATLARDAKRLAAGGYTLKHVTPFDLFPHTYHVESMSFWVISS
jgi:23S rRNA (uracil1939-C5)-methyltransferase